MQQVVFENISATDAIGFKDQLIKDGLVMNKDFIWAYHKARHDDFGYAESIPQMVVFRFEDPALATFYKLKWT
jgi:hypothetical protein